MQHFTVIFRPDNKQISIHKGATLVEAAGEAGIVLNTSCGGRGTCGKCIVNIEPLGQRILACQYRVESDLVITIPDSARFFEHKILTDGIENKNKIKPDIYRKYLPLAANGKIFGLAVDIGTTTVVAKLINMADGQTLSTEAVLNPQTKFGDDVISRITYAQTDAQLDELHSTIINCINELATRLCSSASLNASDIYEMAVVANTTMNHIFLKLPIQQLGQAPYKAFCLDASDRLPGDLNLNINHKGNVHAVANIAGFVGADTTAVALASDMDSVDKMTLAVDIGTNGEVVLGTKERLIAASCAAGPAFEGARIACGSRAVDGAIEAVVANTNDIDLDVIGNAPPHSICGSGLIDAVAVLLDLGIIDITGRFVDCETLCSKLPPPLLSRLIEKDNQPAFLLADGLQPVYLTQRDIRQVQLAKAAIRAGIKLLQNKIGLQDNQIDSILLAGAFGNYIRPESALRIGLLPNVPLDKIHFIGNAACSGAQMVLLSSQARALAVSLAKKITYIEIAHEREFTSVYADCMLFE